MFNKKEVLLFCIILVSFCCYTYFVGNLFWFLLVYFFDSSKFDIIGMNEESFIYCFDGLINLPPVISIVKFNGNFLNYNLLVIILFFLIYLWFKICYYILDEALFTFGARVSFLMILFLELCVHLFYYPLFLCLAASPSIELENRFMFGIEFVYMAGWDDFSFESIWDWICSFFVEPEVVELPFIGEEEIPVLENPNNNIQLVSEIDSLMEEKEQSLLSGYLDSAKKWIYCFFSFFIGDNLNVEIDDLENVDNVLYELYGSEKVDQAFNKLENMENYQKALEKVSFHVGKLGPLPWNVQFALENVQDSLNELEKVSPINLKNALGNVQKALDELARLPLSDLQNVITNFRSAPKNDQLVLVKFYNAFENLLNTFPGEFSNVLKKVEPVEVKVEPAFYIFQMAENDELNQNELVKVESAFYEIENIQPAFSVLDKIEKAFSVLIDSKNDPGKIEYAFENFQKELDELVKVSPGRIQNELEKVQYHFTVLQNVQKAFENLQNSLENVENSLKFVDGVKNIDIVLNALENVDRAFNSLRLVENDSVKGQHALENFQKAFNELEKVCPRSLQHLLENAQYNFNVFNFFREVENASWNVSNAYVNLQNSLRIVENSLNELENFQDKLAEQILFEGGGKSIPSNDPDFKIRPIADAQFSAITKSQFIKHNVSKIEYNVDCTKEFLQIEHNADQMFLEGGGKSIYSDKEFLQIEYNVDGTKFNK